MIVKKIVLIKCAKLIGSDQSRKLSNDNEVIVISELLTGHIDNIKDISTDKKIKYIQGCVMNINLFRKMYGSIYYMFHKIAIPNVLYSIKNLITLNNVITR